MRFMDNERICPMLTPTDDLPCLFYIRATNPKEPGFCKQETRFRCTEAMKKKLPAISYSRLSEFIHCKLRYYHAVVKGLEVRPQYLPEGIKLGRVWDGFIRSRYEEGYDYLSGIQTLQLSPESQAKLSALMRAYQELEISTSNDGLFGCQYKVYTEIGESNLVGFVDRAYEDSIRETKLSGSPDFYRQKENVTFQLGTYFLANEHWEYAVVEITRVPGLRTGQGKFSDEESGDYEARLYSDIISRPSYYFLGWDRKTRTYGVKFWRSEFYLEEIHATYVHLLREIQETAQRGSWYPNNFACHVPGPCIYLPIKRTGVVSEELFEKRSLPTPPAPPEMKDPWCDLCMLTRFMAEMCKVKSPCPKWGKEVE